MFRYVEYKINLKANDEHERMKNLSKTNEKRYQL